LLIEIKAKNKKELSTSFHLYFIFNFLYD